LEKTLPIWQKLGVSRIEVFVTFFTKDDYNWERFDLANEKGQADSFTRIIVANGSIFKTNSAFSI
jgi:hypothetical protein